jgi:hypothetical protein
MYMCKLTRLFSHSSHISWDIVRDALLRCQHNLRLHASLAFAALISELTIG